MKPIDLIKSWELTETHLAPTETMIRNASVVLELFSHNDIQVTRNKNGTINLEVTDPRGNVMTLHIDEYSVKAP